MTIKSFRKIKSDDEVVTQVQDNLESFTRQFINNPLLTGVILTSVALSTGTNNVVSHKLGRVPVGYIVIRNRSNSVIYDSQDGNTTPALNIILNCSANTTIDLYIF